MTKKDYELLSQLLVEAKAKCTSIKDWETVCRSIMIGLAADPSVRQHFNGVKFLEACGVKAA
jgi:hypothetical protein